ncbi:hypothetical protein [Acetobacter tropicalis]|nr:hypothetical protein [Acetobacter tropicalis]
MCESAGWKIFLENEREALLRRAQKAGSVTIQQYPTCSEKEKKADYVNAGENEVRLNDRRQEE